MAITKLENQKPALIDNTELHWIEETSNHKYICKEYDKLKIVLSNFGTDKLYIGLFLGNKLIKKNSVFGNEFCISDMKREAQLWWNTEYRAIRLSIGIRLLKLKDKLKINNPDRKFIEFIRIRLLNDVGGLTEDEIDRLNNIVRNNEIEIYVPDIEVNYNELEDKFEINKDYVIKLEKNSQEEFVWNLYKNKSFVICESYSLEEIFGYVENDMR